MNTKLAEALKAARRTEVEQAVKAFLSVYPEALDVFMQMSADAQPPAAPPEKQKTLMPGTLGLSVSKPKPRQKYFERQLSDETIQEIRRRLVAGERQSKIASDLNVSQSSIYYIGSGRMHGKLPASPEFQAWQQNRQRKGKRRKR